MFSLKEILLNNSKFYCYFQKLLSKKQKSNTPLNIKYKSGDIILDIGCGPAGILSFMPNDVIYYGYDLSSKYIEFAKKHYKNRNAIFKAEKISEINIPPELINKVNYVLAIGLIHHIPDEEVKKLFAIVNIVLCKGGKFISQDNYFCEKQNIISKFLIKNDRGKFVRTEEEYKNLAKNYLGENITVTKRDDLLRIPYNHIFIEYVKK